MKVSLYKSHLIKALGGLGGQVCIMLYVLLLIQNLETVQFKSEVFLKTENSQISKKITGIYYVM